MEPPAFGVYSKVLEVFCWGLRGLGKGELTDSVAGGGGCAALTGLIWKLALVL